MIYQQDRVRRSRPVALSAAAVASRRAGRGRRAGGAADYDSRTDYGLRALTISAPLPGREHRFFMHRFWVAGTDSPCGAPVLTAAPLS